MDLYPLIGMLMAPPEHVSIYKTICPMCIFEMLVSPVCYVWQYALLGSTWTALTAGPALSVSTARRMTPLTARAVGDVRTTVNQPAVSSNDCGKASGVMVGTSFTGVNAQ